MIKLRREMSLEGCFEKDEDLGNWIFIDDGGTPYAIENKEMVPKTRASHYSIRVAYYPKHNGRIKLLEVAESIERTPLLPVAI